jgi:hypothetical protein
LLLLIPTGKLLLGIGQLERYCYFITFFNLFLLAQ